MAREVPISRLAVVKNKNAPLIDRSIIQPCYLGMYLKKHLTGELQYNLP